MTKRSRNGDLTNRKSTTTTQKGVSDVSSLFSDLPVEVSREIFFKLPIKDVMRCKCVCKDWNNVLSNPNFSEDYAKSSPFTSVLRCMSPSVVNLAPNVSYLLEISENVVDCIHAPFNPNLPDWLRKKQSLSFVGSCNGFVCMKVANAGFDVVYVTNPIMGDPIALPQREMDKDHRYLERYNFGFSPSVNQYKVLRIDFRSYVERGADECKIFTVGVDRMWRHLPDSHTGVSFLSDCVALNEAFHWLPMEIDIDWISTFDLVEEKFGRVSLPASSFPVPELMNLALLDNQLSLVDSSNPSQISIWKMKKYSVVESWYKVFVLRTWFPPAPITGYPALVSIIELKNGDMLLSYCNGVFVTCNIEQKKCPKIEVDGHGSLTYHSIFAFTPNFSSPAELIMEGQGNTANDQLE